MNEEPTIEEIAEAYEGLALACRIFLENLRKEIEPIIEQMVKILEENDEYILSGGTNGSRNDYSDSGDG